MNGHMKQKEQSRKMIEDALFELLDEKEYSQITITEIVKRADVARRTFYRLYESKESVIGHYFKQLCEKYKSSHPALKGYDLKQIALDFFSFWYREKEVLLKLHRVGLDDMLYFEISRASTEVVGGRVSSEKLRESEDLAYFACYSVGGFVNLLFRWIDSGMEEMPEVYAEIVSGAIAKFI